MRRGVTITELDAMSARRACALVEILRRSDDERVHEFRRGIRKGGIAANVDLGGLT